MEFHLKKVLLALLFSTSESLSIKDIQAVITRYHRQGNGDWDETGQSSGERTNPDQPMAGHPPSPDEVPKSALPSQSAQAIMRELISQVPTLLTIEQIRGAMVEIGQEFLEKRDVVRLVEGPTGYRLAISPEYADWVRLLRDEPRPQRLTAAALETLAVVAYRQPVTRSEIEAVRGVSCDNALNRLLERDLVHVMGRAELPGRPIQYGTTQAFLEMCGLRSLEELPASDVLSPNEITEWIRKATHPERQLSDSDMGLPPEEIGLATTEDAPPPP